MSNFIQENKYTSEQSSSFKASILVINDPFA